MSGEAKSAQADPCDACGIHGVKDLLHRLPYFILPPVVVDERIKMESQLVAPLSAFRRCRQPFFKDAALCSSVRQMRFEFTDQERTVCPPCSRSLKIGNLIRFGLKLEDSVWKSSEKWNQATRVVG